MQKKQNNIIIFIAAGAILQLASKPCLLSLPLTKMVPNGIDKKYIWNKRNYWWKNR